MFFYFFSKHNEFHGTGKYFWHVVTCNVRRSAAQLLKLPSLLIIDPGIRIPSQEGALWGGDHTTRSRYSQQYSLGDRSDAAFLCRYCSILNEWMNILFVNTDTIQ